MGKEGLIFKSDKIHPLDIKLSADQARCLPYRLYEPLSLRWSLEPIRHLTPNKASIDRLPEGLPDQVVRAVEGFVNDAKIHGKWFCIKDGDLDDDQDEDILTSAAYADEDGDYLITDYPLYQSNGYHGPTPKLIKLLCGE